MSFPERNIIDNLPLIIQLEYVFAQEVDSITDTVVLKNAATWKKIPFQKKSIKTDTKPKDSAAGTLYETSVKFRIAKDEKSFTDELLYLSARDLVFRETDYNGIVRIIGSKDIPAQLQFGISKIGFNGYECEISCTDKEPPIYI